MSRVVVSVSAGVLALGVGLFAVLSGPGAATGERQVTGPTLPPVVASPASPAVATTSLVAESGPARTAVPAEGRRDVPTTRPTSVPFRIGAPRATAPTPAPAPTRTPVTAPPSAAPPPVGSCVLTIPTMVQAGTAPPWSLTSNERQQSVSLYLDGNRYVGAGNTNLSGQAAGEFNMTRATAGRHTVEAVFYVGASCSASTTVQ